MLLLASLSSASRRLAPPPGHGLAELSAQARQVLADVDNLVKRANERSEPRSGPFRLGVIPTVAPYILAPALRMLARRFPQLRPEVTEDQTVRLLDELTEGSLDAVVLALPTNAKTVVEVPLYWEPFVLLLPPEHPLAGRGGLDLAVLRDLRLLLLEEGHCLAGQAFDVCRQVGAATDHAARAASLTTIAQLVAAGLGATLLPAPALPVETRKGKLAVARFRAPAPGRRIGLVFRAADARSSEYLQLAEYLRRALDRPGFAGRIERGPSSDRTAALGSSRP